MALDKELHAYLITWVTHNSRISERMVEFGVKKGDPICFTVEGEVLITRIILEIVKQDNLCVLAYNICCDHIHIILVCADTERDNVVRKLKSKSAFIYHRMQGKGLKTLVNNGSNISTLTCIYHLWAQKYYWQILRDDKALKNAIEYVLYNRANHDLPESARLQSLIRDMVSLETNLFCEREHSVR